MRRLLALLCVLALLPGCALAQSTEAFGLNIDLNAEVLDFDALDVNVTDADALDALIRRMPNLREVRMYHSRMKREGMEKLFDAHPHVFFGFTIRFDIHTVRTDATAFSTLHRSQITDKRDDYHTNRELSVLRMCTRLKALDLGHNKLTDLSFVSGLTDLRVLILSPNYGLVDLSPLTGLEKLEYLELFSTNATDVSPLAGLENLRDLNLACSDQLRDISPLYELPHLERFWCGRGKVPQEQLKLMADKHPGCHCDFESLPTRGGWREHPHYDVIYRMFREGEYIPFE